MPYDITGMIYTDIVDWIGLELFVNVNESRCQYRMPRSWPGKIPRRPIDSLERDSVRMRYEADLRDNKDRRPRFYYYTLSRDGEPVMCGPVRPKTLPRTASLFEAIVSVKPEVQFFTNFGKYPTLLGLLQTCKQIRAQFGEHLWRRQQFEMKIYFTRDVKKAFCPLLDRFLARPFATGSAYDNLQKFSLSIGIDSYEFPMYTSNQCQRGVAVAQTEMLLSHILTRMPNLRELTIDIPINYYKRGENFDLRYIPLSMLSLLLKASKQAKRLEILHVSVYTPGEPGDAGLYDTILEDWSRRSWEHVEDWEVEKLTWTKTEYTLKNVSLQSLEKALERTSLILPRIKAAGLRYDRLMTLSKQNDGFQSNILSLRSLIDLMTGVRLTTMDADGTK